MSTSPPPTRRLGSLDAFRGVTIAGMILVNNPGSWSHVYPPLRHAEWHGCTPTDLIFPFFLFIVGVAMAYSVPRQLERGRPAFWRNTLRRTVWLIGLGLLLNAVMPIAASLRTGDPSLLLSIRLPGVLQRIGLVYLLVCLCVVMVGFGSRIALSIGVLVLTPVAMWLFRPADPFEPAGNLASWIDRLTLPDRMLYHASPTDPEGLLGTLTASVTALIGYEIGRWIRSAPAIGPGLAARLVTIGVAVAGAGWLASSAVPLNKPLWTSSYVLFTAGVACVGLGLCLVWCDLARLPGRRLAALVGRHAITVFVGSGLLARALVLIPAGGAPNLKAWMFDVIAGVGLSAIDASLVFAIGMVSLWTAIAYAMDRAGLVFRV